MTDRGKSSETIAGLAGEVALSSADRSKLRMLFAAHVILGLIFAIWSAVDGQQPIALPFLLVVPALGFALSQAALLGFWAVFSSARWWIRLVGVIIGSLYLEFLVNIGGQEGGEFRFLALMATFGIAGVLFVIHWRFVDFYRLTQQARRANKEGLKFSIRDLMIFTFIVAVSLIGIRTLPEYLNFGSDIILVAIWSLCSVVIGLACIWASLGVGSPLPWSFVVVMVSAVLGFVFTHVAVGQSDPETLFYLVSIMVLNALLIIFPLQILRSFGYRVVRKSVPDVRNREPTTPSQPASNGVDLL